MVLLLSHLLQRVTILPPSHVLHPQEPAAHQLLKDKVHKTQAKENMLVTGNLKDTVAHICLRGSAQLWSIML